MKKLTLMAAALLLSAATFAQTTAPVIANADVKPQMKDLRKDVKAYHKDKAEVKADVNKGQIADAKADLAKVKMDKQDIKGDVKVLKSEGVKHPLIAATKEVKKADVKAVKAEVVVLKKDRADVKADVASGDLTDAKTARAAVKADRAELKKDIRAARRDGVKRVHKVK